LITRARLFAAAAVVVALILDVAVKRLVLAHDWDGTTLIPGLLDLHYAWNRGVSFSLFWQSETVGSAVLAIALSAIIAAIAVWAFRAANPLLAAGLGLIVGGALGNIADRYIHGAVFDFLVVRLGSFPLFVCNGADVFITLGAIAIAWDTLFGSENR
jgi:signal peptidase II